MKNKEAAKLRDQYESEIRQAATKKNIAITAAKSIFATEVKAIKKRIYPE